MVTLWMVGAAIAADAGPGCPVDAPQPARARRALATLGRALFFEPQLSASGRLSCASCHDPRHAYGPAPDSVGTAIGGARLDRSGLRAVPSLRYTQWAPRFEWHFHVARGDEREDVGPGGGYMADGRADSLRAQALLPLLDANEMANPDVHTLAAKLRTVEPVRLWLRGQSVRIGREDATVVACAAAALAAFQQDDVSFHPYSSRYDDYLQGRDALTAQELRGLAVFSDARKGNCAECHPAVPGAGGAPPLFTDFRFAALGVPRNPRLPANADASFQDRGLCGPLRAAEDAQGSTCGFFKTPTLRNVAQRPYFFHNARFTSLREVLQFYVTRDLDHSRWYGGAAGYDDLPAAQQLNVDRSDAPFDRRPGDAPALSESEIDDLLAFLRTLDDRS